MKRLQVTYLIDVDDDVDIDDACATLEFESEGNGSIETARYVPGNKMHFVSFSFQAEEV